MDPITALALACNVTQLVEQAIEAASVCKEIYERGALDENNKIEEYANDIAAANKDLEATLKAQKVTPSTHPARLQRVVNDATATTAELKKVLNQLKLSKKQGNKQIGGAFRATLKAIFKRGVIESLRQKLEQQDAALRSAILKDLYIRTGQVDLTRKDEFKVLSQGQKDAIAQVLGSLQAVSNDLVASVKASETVLAARLTSQDVQLERSMRMLSTDIPATVRGAEARLVDRFDGQDSLLKDAAQKHNMQTKYFQDQAEDALRDRLLDALAFPEMNERRNMIEGRVVDFGKTYAWVFNPPNEEARIFRNQQRHAFVEWLRTGQEVFWINGKPGSGKSTLMDFIYQNLQSGRQGLVHLEAWAQPQPVRLLSFWFFRPAASRLLKSLDGFWRSLCFQILDMDADIVRKIRADMNHSAPDSLRACLVESGSRAQSWTNIELKSWLRYLLTHSVFNYFLLIDGLDEVLNDPEGLLDAIQFITQSSNKIKICCSSRPEAPFPRALQKYPSLRLQDFNGTDIRAHCNVRLATTRAALFAEEVAFRAEGVFLWAYLVVEDLRIAASQGDDQDDLKRRLKECPGEMNELFMFLLERQDKFYAKHPKPYLRLADVATRGHTKLTLFEMLVASQEQEMLRCNFPDNLDTQFLASLDAMAENFEANVIARCAGLVEFHPHFGLDFSKTFPSLVKMRKLELRFIHRSAQDFVVDSEAGAALLQSCNISEQEALRRLMTASAVSFLISKNVAYLANIMSYGREINRAFWTDFDSRVMDNVFRAAQRRLLPRLPPPLSEDKDENRWLADRTYALDIVCPHLSPLQNVVFSYAVGWGLIPYLEARLSTLDPDELRLVAGFGACLSLSDTNTQRCGYETRNDILAMLKPHLSWTQTPLLCHRWDKACYVRVARPVWQCSLYTELDLAESATALCHYLQFLYNSLSSTDGETLRILAYLIYHDYETLSIFAEPDEPMELVMESVEEFDVFKIHIILHEPSQGGPFRLEFYQHFPRGLGRFCEIEATVNEGLQQLFSGCIPASSVEDLIMANLNHHLTSLSAEEIAKVLSNRGSERRYGRSYIFSNRQFHYETKDGRERWEQRLKSGIFNMDFEAGPEQDPILKEIMKMLQCH